MRHYFTQRLTHWQIKIGENLNRSGAKKESLPFMKKWTSVLTQRVLNNFNERARFSSGRMIQIHAHPLPPSPVRKWAVFLSRRLSLRGRGKGLAVEPNYTTARKRSPLQIIHYSLVLTYMLDKLVSTRSLTNSTFYVFCLQRACKILLSFPLLSHHFGNIKLPFAFGNFCKDLCEFQESFSFTSALLTYRDRFD